MTRPEPGDPVPAGDCRPRSLVLVAAADPQVGTVTARILRSAGFDVLEADGGVAAVETCRARPGEVAAVLMDVRMPGVTGAEILAAIRGLDPLVRCFLMTGAPGAYCPAALARAGAERVFARRLTSRHSSGR